MSVHHEVNIEDIHSPAKKSGFGFIPIPNPNPTLYLIPKKICLLGMDIGMIPIHQYPYPIHKKMWVLVLCMSMGMGMIPKKLFIWYLILVLV